jgi:hypothetical protein
VKTRIRVEKKELINGDTDAWYYPEYKRYFWSIWKPCAKGRSNLIYAQMEIDYFLSGRPKKETTYINYP